MTSFALADSVIDSFFSDLREEALRESEVLLKSSKAKSKVFCCKLNRHRLYLKEGAFAAACAHSRGYLSNHGSWISGRRALSYEELRKRVALQHFTAVDFEDLLLPPQFRRNDDTFNDMGVSDQLLLDAACSDFVVDGERCSFRDELEAFGDCDVDDQVLEARLLDFEARLTTMLLRSLGGQQHRTLVQAVTRAMSQAGVANLERACAGPQVVVSGGEQTLCHELSKVAANSWELRTFVRKHGFQEIIFLARANANESASEPCGSMIQACGAGSYTIRSCALRIHVPSTRDSGLEVEVLEVDDQFVLVDSTDGRHAPPGPRSGDAKRHRRLSRRASHGTHVWDMLRPIRRGCRSHRQVKSRPDVAADFLPGAIEIVPITKYACGANGK